MTARIRHITVGADGDAAAPSKQLCKCVQHKMYHVFELTAGAKMADFHKQLTSHTDRPNST